MKRLLPVFLILCMIVTCFPYSAVSAADKGGSLLYRHLPGEDLEVSEGLEIYRKFKKQAHPVIVAVIDTGIDISHPDLEKNIWINEGEIPDNGIDDDGNGYIDDIYGWDFYNDDNTVFERVEEENGECHSLTSDCDDHGTHVAGIIAASGNSDEAGSVSGIAGNCGVRVMTLKIHGGKNRKGKLSDAIKAIKYAESMGASVCNISWGTYNYSDTLAGAIKHSGMLFVCAAGNDGTNNDNRPIYPASFGFDNIISVGFTDHDGTLTYCSNYGRDSIDIMIPSTDITSTVVGGYGLMGGSSMAAANVSGIAALIYSLSDHTWAGSVKDVIMNSINPVEDLDLFTKSGGIPSLKKAMESIGVLQSDKTAPLMELSVGYDENGIALSFDTEDEGGSGVCRINYLFGARKVSDFDHGTVGMTVEDDHAYLSKGGTYTFYVEDGAGNASVYTLPIIDDIVRPVISGITMSAASDESGIVVRANVSDLHSGVKTVKYMRGVHQASDFRRSGAGNVVEPDEDGNVVFSVPEQGTYTLFAVDHRGNQTTITIRAYSDSYSGVEAWGVLRTTASASTAKN